MGRWMRMPWRYLCIYALKQSSSWIFFLLRHGPFHQMLCGTIKYDGKNAHTVNSQLFVDIECLNSKGNCQPKFYRAVYSFMQNMVLVKLVTAPFLMLKPHRRGKYNCMCSWCSLQVHLNACNVSLALYRFVRRWGGLTCLFARSCSRCLHTLLTHRTHTTEHSCEGLSSVLLWQPGFCNDKSGMYVSYHLLLLDGLLSNPWQRTHLSGKS